MANPNPSHKFKPGNPYGGRKRGVTLSGPLQDEFRRLLKAETTAEMEGGISRLEHVLDLSSNKNPLVYSQLITTLARHSIAVPQAEMEFNATHGKLVGEQLAEYLANKTELSEQQRAEMLQHFSDCQKAYWGDDE